MSSLARAWDAFMKAIEDARALAVRRAQPDAIADLTRDARKMLGILESEIANHQSMTVSGAHEVLAKLRNRLAVLEKEVATATETTNDAEVLASVESAGLASRETVRRATLS
jgi:hypothetical protein